MNATKLSTILQEWLDYVQVLGVVEGTRDFIFVASTERTKKCKERWDAIIAEAQRDELEDVLAAEGLAFEDFDNPIPDVDARTGRSFKDYEGSATMPITEKDFDFADSFDINELPF